MCRRALVDLAHALHDLERLLVLAAVVEREDVVDRARTNLMRYRPATSLEPRRLRRVSSITAS